MALATTHATTQPTVDTTLSEDLVAAIVTGQIAGLIMAVVVMLVFTLFLGHGPLHPVQVIGSMVFGDAALRGIHVGAILVGLVLHQLGPSLFWALVFGAIVHASGIRRGAGVVALGAIIGLISQVVDVNLLMGPIMRAFHGRDIWAAEVPAFWSWAAHLVFGLALGIFPSVYQRVEARLAH
jgi:hypothetical protein